jgi:hypothetical protein
MRHPSLVYDDPRYWLARGTAARQTAAEMADPYIRECMLAVARQYDMAARHVVERLKAFAQDIPSPMERSGDRILDGRRGH